jgi:hypothetical protein
MDTQDSQMINSRMAEVEEIQADVERRRNQAANVADGTVTKAADVLEKYKKLRQVEEQSRLTRDKINALREQRERLLDANGRFDIDAVAAEVARIDQEALDNFAHVIMGAGGSKQSQLL